MDHTVRGLLRRFSRSIVEQQDGSAMPREIMLEREDLPSIAQRTLGQQADFGQTVQHDAAGFDTLEYLEDCTGRLAKLKVGRIEQALLLFPIQQTLGGNQ